MFAQGGQDSNLQSTVLETVALPLGHHPICVELYRTATQSRTEFKRFGSSCVFRYTMAANTTLAHRIRLVQPLKLLFFGESGTEADFRPENTFGSPPLVLCTAVPTRAHLREILLHETYLVLLACFHVPPAGIEPAPTIHKIAAVVPFGPGGYTILVVREPSGKVPVEVSV